ncbi:hypothetical protein HDU93_009235 [Gonapodya sp. JEL0774]|nr:hypothetical protein HDU93_009235 [Gonapodya sp. JEL0774]
MSMLTLAADFHDSAAVQKMADTVFYPRLHRLVKDELSRPNIEATVGLAHAFIHVVSRSMWNVGYFYLTMMCGSLRILGLSDEYTLARKFPAWSDRETCRRLFWAVYQLDRASSAASMQMQQISDDLCSLLRLQSPENEWIARVPPEVSPVIAPTLEDFYTHHGELPVDGSYENLHRSKMFNGVIQNRNTNGATPTFLSRSIASPLGAASIHTALFHLFGRVIDLRLSCSRRNILPFDLPPGPTGLKVFNRVKELEQDLLVWEARLNEFVRAVGVRIGAVGWGLGSLELGDANWRFDGLTEVDFLYLQAEYHIIQTRGGSPRSAPIEWSPPPQFAQLATRFGSPSGPGEEQLEHALTAWKTRSPSFIAALTSACKACDLIERIAVLDHNDSYGTAVNWSFSLILLFAAFELAMNELSTEDLKRRVQLLTGILRRTAGKASGPAASQAHQLVQKMFEALVESEALISIVKRTGITDNALCFPVELSKLSRQNLFAGIRRRQLLAHEPNYVVFVWAYGNATEGASTINYTTRVYGNVYDYRNLPPLANNTNSSSTNITERLLGNLTGTFDQLSSIIVPSNVPGAGVLASPALLRYTTVLNNTMFTGLSIIAPDTGYAANRARWFVLRYGIHKAFHQAICKHSPMVDLEIVEKLIGLQVVISRQDVQLVFRAVFRPRPGYGLPTFRIDRTTPIIRLLTAHACTLYGDEASFDGDDYRIFRDIMGCIQRSHTAITCTATDAQVAALRSLVSVYRFNPQHVRPPLSDDKLTWLLLHLLLTAPDLLDELVKNGFEWSPAIREGVMGWSFLYYCLDPSNMDPILTSLISKYNIQINSGVLKVLLNKLSKPDHSFFHTSIAFAKILSLCPSQPFVRNTIMDDALERFVKNGQLDPFPRNLPFSLLDLPTTPASRLTLLLQHLAEGRPLPPSISPCVTHRLPFPAVVKLLLERQRDSLRLALQAYLATSARGWAAADEDYFSAMDTFAQAGVALEPSDIEVVRIAYAAGKTESGVAFVRAFFGVVAEVVLNNLDGILNPGSVDCKIPRGEGITWKQALEAARGDELERIVPLRELSELTTETPRKRKGRTNSSSDSTLRSEIGHEVSEVAEGAAFVLAQIQRASHGGSFERNGDRSGPRSGHRKGLENATNLEVSNDDLSNGTLGETLATSSDLPCGTFTRKVDEIGSQSLPDSDEDDATQFDEAPGVVSGDSSQEGDWLDAPKRRRTR